ncbi:MAG: hypothetical protein ACLFUJ_00330 [Phycisphaerae bacterium]
MQRRYQLLIAMLAGAAVCVGCTGPGRPARLADWQSPEALYLSDRTCDRLYVQIDHLEGIYLNEEDFVQPLVDFLSAHCDKPRGIVVHRDSPIPADMAAGNDEIQLALRRMHMPAEMAAGNRTAYLYVLFYDSSRQANRRAERPYVRTEYPAAIFVDMAYFTPMTRIILPIALRHEAAHILGLSKNLSHSDGAHCKQPDCLVNAVLRVHRPSQPSPQADPCRDCQADLQAVRENPGPENMRFAGPVLVRQEDGYTVASLPSCTRVIFDDGRQIDYGRIQAQARVLARNSKTLYDQMLYDTMAVTVASYRLAEIRTALVNAQNDPDAGVAKIAAELAEKLKRHLAASGRN